MQILEVGDTEVMSWKATAWAKETRGHQGYGQKLMLMMLAEYHNTEKDMAWPSQAALARDCEMPERTVRHELNNLERRGFITTLQKGNQHQPTLYRLNFDVLVAGAQESEPAKSEPATIAGASEPAKTCIVNRQKPASEPATPRMTNQYRTVNRTDSGSLPPNDSSATLQNHSAPKGGENHSSDSAQENSSTPEVWPEWYSLLYGVEGFKASYAQAEEWRVKKGIPEALALDKAYALRDWWPRQIKSRTKNGNPYLTWQNWCNRDSNSNAPAPPNSEKPKPKSDPAFAKY